MTPRRTTGYRVAVGPHPPTALDQIHRRTLVGMVLQAIDAAGCARPPRRSIRLQLRTQGEVRAATDFLFDTQRWRVHTRYEEGDAAPWKVTIRW